MTGHDRPRFFWSAVVIAMSFSALLIGSVVYTSRTDLGWIALAAVLIALLVAMLFRGGTRWTTDATSVTQDELRAIHSRYRKLLESSGAIFFEGTPDLLWTDASGRFQRLLGWNPKEIIGESILDSLHPEDSLDLQARVRECLENELAFSMAIRIRDRSGGWHGYDWTVAPMNTAGGEERLIVCARSADEQRRVDSLFEGLNQSAPEADHQLRAIAEVRDVSDRVRAETERRNIESQMHRSQKLESLGVLVAGVAHDFKNLLGAITNCADLTLWSLDDAASARRAIWQIKVAVGQMADLSDQLFDYAGCSSLMAEPLDLCALVRETQPLLESLLPKSTKVAYELDGELLGIEGDPSQIRQVLVNLITNASESLMGEPGCVTVRTGTRRVGRDLLAEAYRGIDLEEGEFVYLEVQDTGCGMDAETQSGVFDPFFSTKQDGRGLGMAAVGDILRRHGGAIRIESSPGEGATFSVLFKALPDRARALPERTPPDERGERPPETPILVVDDE